jgi:hypothetical protein
MEDSHKTMGDQQRLMSIEKVGQVDTLLAVTMLFTVSAALADSSANNIKDCPDQNWCAYHRTTDS